VYNIIYAYIINIYAYIVAIYAYIVAIYAYIVVIYAYIVIIYALKAQESQTYKKIKMVKIYAGITKLKMDVNVACANSVMCAQCVMKNIPHISTSLSKGNSNLSFLAHLPIKLINGKLN
jgi:hypothetical protein